MQQADRFIACLIASVLVALACIAPARAQVSAQATWVAAANVGGASGNAIALSNVPGISALADLVGVPLRFIPNANNSTATTISVNGLTATAVKKQTSIGLLALCGGEFSTLQAAEVVYDGTQFELRNPLVKAPTYQTLTSGTTYTPTSSCVTNLIVREVGGGGGGGGNGTGSPTSGGAGGNTSFNAIVANGGGGGGNNGGTGAGAGGAGGTGGTGSCPTRIPGGNGGGYATTAGISSTVQILNSTGGSSQLGRGSPSGNAGGADGGTTLPEGFGAGGGGSGSGSAPTFGAAAGGGGGEYCETPMAAPATTYTIAIGAPGTKGLAGTGGGTNGAPGTAGAIIVQELYS